MFSVGGLHRLDLRGELLHTEVLGVDKLLEIFNALLLKLIEQCILTLQGLSS